MHLPASIRRAGLSASSLIAMTLLLPPAPAYALVSGIATVSFPAVLSPGQTDVLASITLTNDNSGADLAQPNTVTSITLLPSCGAVSSGACTAGGNDPGVFLVSSTGIGAFGTQCNGQTFTISEVDAASGRLQITPVIPLVLGFIGASCTIDFKLDVLKQPTKDATAAVGPQTIQILDASMQSGGGTATPRDTSTTTVTLSPQICADIDGDGRQDGLSDGLIFLRALFGTTGSAVVNGATSAGSTRTTWDSVKAHMNTLCGTSF